MSLMSDSARLGLEQIFKRAVQSRLLISADDSCEIEQQRTGFAWGQRKEDIVVITISSLQFRLLVVLHVDSAEATRIYLGNGEGTVALGERFYELANLCCGAVNQDLQRHFPDLGMSTPQTLNGPCASYLDALLPSEVMQFSIIINGSIHIGATLCVCAQVPLDFTYEISAVEETSGELALF